MGVNDAGADESVCWVVPEDGIDESSDLFRSDAAHWWVEEFSVGVPHAAEEFGS
jgi:hypothetical protein